MIATLVAWMVLADGASTPVNAALKAKVIAQIDTVLRTKAYAPGVDLNAWLSLVAKHREEIDHAEDANELALALNETLAEFGTSHFGVAPPGRGRGKGIESYGFVSQVVEGKTVVTTVFHGTSAERAGLWPGMTLSSFNFPGYPDLGRIEVGIDDGPRSRIAVVDRERFTPRQKDPYLFWNPERTCGFLTAPSFNDYDEKVVEATLRQANQFPNLVIDLRGNAGGSPHNMNHFLGAFLPVGTRIGASIRRPAPADMQKVAAKSPGERAESVRRSAPEETETVRENPVQYKGRIVVLIDGGTASAAEIATQALREFGHVPVFGLPSSGAVLYANGEALAGGFHFVFPWRDYWSARGERLEGHPIAPDPEISPETPLQNAQRFSLQEKAAAWLAKRSRAR